MAFPCSCESVAYHTYNRGSRLECMQTTRCLKNTSRAPVKQLLKLLQIQLGKFDKKHQRKILHYAEYHWTSVYAEYSGRGGWTGVDISTHPAFPLLLLKLRQSEDFFGRIEKGYFAADYQCLVLELNFKVALYCSYCIINNNNTTTTGTSFPDYNILWGES